MSPIDSLSPTRTSQTMRRATRPAICTATISTPSAVRIRTLLRSLLVARLGQVGRAEPARPVVHGDHLAADRGPLHVGVEQRQEDADPGELRLAHLQFGRRRGRFDEAHLAVGRRDDAPGRVGGTRGG